MVKITNYTTDRHVMTRAETNIYKILAEISKVTKKLQLHRYRVPSSGAKNLVGLERIPTMTASAHRPIVDKANTGRSSGTRWV